MCYSSAFGLTSWLGNLYERKKNNLVRSKLKKA